MTEFLLTTSATGVPSEPDELTRKQLAELHAINLQSIRDIIEFRRKYADNFFTLIVFWLFFISICIFLNATNGLDNHYAKFKFHISDSIMIALITTTTISVIGLLMSIVVSIFPKKFYPREK